MPTVPAIPEAVSHLVRHLWAAAWKAADSVHEPEREKFQRGRVEQERLRAKMGQEIARLGAELSRVEAERVKAESTARTLQAELTELRDEKRKTPETVTAWVERASRAEARLEELAKGAEGRWTWVRSQAFWPMPSARKLSASMDGPEQHAASLAIAAAWRAPSSRISTRTGCFSAAQPRKLEGAGGSYPQKGNPP